MILFAQIYTLTVYGVFMALLCNAKAIGAHCGLPARAVYDLAEKNPDFPAFKLRDSPKSWIYARSEDLDSWLNNRAQRGRNNTPTLN